MSENYIQSIKHVLDALLDTQIDLTNLDASAVKKGLTLRAPKNEGWGDLCTNILLLICAEDTIRRKKLAPVFLNGFMKLSEVASATLSSAGYINIKIKTDYWGTQISDVLRRGTSYGLTRNELNSNIILHRPEHSDDLLSTRQMWNADVLERLAKLSNMSVSFEPWLADEAKGFATSVAIAKCSYSRLRLALLSNGEDFAINFSPAQAVDMAYSNPVFCIPFAHSRITALLDKVRGEGLEDMDTDLELVEVLDDLNLSLPIEQKIAKFLCHWPTVVNKTLREGDAVYLTIFLHELSLLFFQLIRDVRPQSTEYLTEKNSNIVRQVLLQAIDKLICGGLDVLGIDRVEELNQ